MTFDMQQVRVSARIKRKPTRYEVSVVTRDEVGAFKPFLWEQSVFEKGPMFRYAILLLFIIYRHFINKFVLIVGNGFSQR